MFKRGDIDEGMPSHPPPPPPPPPPSTLSPGEIAGISIGCVLFLLLLVAICIALVVIAVVLVIRARQKTKAGASHQCGGTTGGPMSSRPLPPVVLVTNGPDPMYAEVADSQSYNKLNYMREECTGEQKMAATAEVGDSPKPNGNSPLYHTLEPADDECCEVASDYMQPVSSHEVCGDCSEPAAVAEST